jgi:hypothetical protein
VEDDPPHAAAVMTSTDAKKRFGMKVHLSRPILAGCYATGRLRRRPN